MLLVGYRATGGVAERLFHSPIDPRLVPVQATHSPTRHMSAIASTADGDAAASRGVRG
jgi:hypothetical protein